MPSIRKKGKGYEITISKGYNSNNKKITESTTFIPKKGWSEEKARKEAEKYAYQLEDRIKSGYSLAADKITFEKFSQIFITDMECRGYIAETTLFDYKKRLELRLVPALGQLKLSQISNHVMNKYADMLREDGCRLDGKSGRLSESTISKDCAIVSSILSYAVQEGYLQINPLIFAGKQRGKKQLKREYVTNQLEIEQAQNFLWLLENPVDILHKEHQVIRNGKPVQIAAYTQRWQLALKWKLYFYIVIFSGARRGEVVALRWTYFDFENDKIGIFKSTASIPGKIIQKDTKSYARRSADMPHFVMELAKELMAEQKRLCMQLGDQWQGHRGSQFNENFVFITDTGAQMSLYSPRKEFKRLLSIYNTNVATSDDMKLPEDITLHDLRHTTAAILISQNMDPQTVSGVLGHSQVSTTMNIYSYQFKSKKTEAPNVLQTVLMPNTLPDNQSESREKHA